MPHSSVGDTDCADDEPALIIDLPSSDILVSLASDGPRVPQFDVHYSNGRLGGFEAKTRPGGCLSAVGSWGKGHRRAPEKFTQYT